MYITICKWMTSTSLTHEAGHQSWCSGTTQRDGVRREAGGRFRVWRHMYTCGQFVLMYGKKNLSILK